MEVGVIRPSLSSRRACTREHDIITSDAWITKECPRGIRNQYNMNLNSVNTDSNDTVFHALFNRQMNGIGHSYYWRYNLTL